VGPPHCFPAASLAGGSNAWPLFTGNVGKGGGNAIHDIACLQAALANVQIPGTSNAFWARQTATSTTRSPASSAPQASTSRAPSVPATPR